MNDEPRLIIERGRGPQIAGTRITVYRVLDFLRDRCQPSEIAAELGLAEEQVNSAIDYIDRNRSDVEAKYALILSRVDRPNAPGVDEGRARTPDELRRAIMGRRAGGGDRPHPRKRDA